MYEFLWAFLGMLVLIFARLPIAVSMAIAGFVGLGLLRDWDAAISSTTAVIYETGFSYQLSVVPLFILMGNFVTRAGLSEELYRASYAFIGHFRGGLAMSTIVGCAGFGAICGSSIATAATFAKVSYPSMKEFGYSDQLAAGTISAGGTLGILIPPSVVMVLYGIMTETNIGKLFAAGILPGLLAAALLCAAIQYQAWRDPAAGPRGVRCSWTQRWVALKGVWGVLVLFTVVMGGIYGGVFTPTEGAGIGAFGGFLFALFRRVLAWRVLIDILVETTRTTAMLFAVLIGALIFASFANFTSMPDDLKTYVEQFQVNPIWVIVAICAIYVVLGAAMEELSMILLTVPVFFPLVVGLGFDPVWFGVIIVLVVMIGLISPPVGMNMFVVRSLLPNITLGTVFRGVLPFVIVEVALLGLLVAFPQITLLLPNALFR